MIAIVVAPPAPQFIPTEAINQPISVASPPSWLSDLNPGSTIQAVVQSTNADGLTTVVTSAGTLSFQAPTTLVNTSQILLQVTQSSAGQSQPQIQIVQVTAPAPPPAYNAAVLTDITPQGVASLPIPGAVVIAQVERTLAPVDGPTLALQNATGAPGPSPGSATTSPILAGASPLAGVVGAVAINTAVVPPTATLPAVPATLLVQALASAPPTGAITEQAILPSERTPYQAPGGGQQSPEEDAAGTAGQQNPPTTQTTAPTAPGPASTASAEVAANTAIANQVSLAAQVSPNTAPAAQTAAAAPAPSQAPSGPTVPPPPPGQAAATTTLTVSTPSLAPENHTVPVALANAIVGQRIAVQIVNISPPGSPSYSAGAQAAASDPTASGAGAAAATTVSAAKTVPSFVATVVGSDAAGQPILSSGPVLITLATGAPPPGTKVTLAVVPETAPAALGAAVPASGDVAPAAALLTASQGTGAAAAVNALMPQAGPALAAQMAFYAGALQQGDIKVWLGDAARAALDRTSRGRQALDSVSDDMASTHEVNASAGPGNWQAMTIPFANGAVVDPIRLYVLQTDPDAEGEATEKASDATRFLVDVQLTKLGRFQIDGFARPDRLDLIIRTPQPLDQALKTGIEQVYINVGSARGLGGVIAFQVAPPVVPPTPRPPPGPSAGILV
jgi:hypothetical protein